MKASVVMELEQWQGLINILTSVPLPWQQTNPLIVVIGGQLKMQAPMQGNSHIEDQLGQSTN